MCLEWWQLVWSLNQGSLMPRLKVDKTVSISELQRDRPSCHRGARRGVSAAEVVTATAVGVPMAAALFFLARAGSKAFLEMSSVVIGWPHM